ncbi:unnamed protein product [Caenorhabditis auriculariae]|uniref:Ankyrin repeat protein n=1 Tax=Caenorhabditis auriculariae TaxID=2777116 RepID=A0A8S1H2L8_9PELO|nr:unnamed protein product [Caenorhabditis auriculariae]
MISVSGLENGIDVKTETCKTTRLNEGVAILDCFSELLLDMAIGFDTEPPLFAAVRDSNIKQVKLLCEKGASVQDRDEDGKTLFMKSDFFDYEESAEIFKFIIAQGLSVNAVDDDGLSALHYAIIDRNIILVKLLTSEGASFETAENFTNPLFVAALDPDCPEIFAHLIEYVEDRVLKKDALLLRATTELLSCQEELNLEKLDCLRRPLGMITDKDRENYCENPIRAYDYLNEATSFREFEAEKPEDLKRFVILQCFIMRERILDESHPAVRNQLRRDNDLIHHTAYLYFQAEGLSESSIFVISYISTQLMACSMVFNEGRSQETWEELVELADELLDEVFYALRRAIFRRVENDFLKEVGESIFNLLYVIGSAPKSPEDRTERGFRVSYLSSTFRIAEFHEIPLFHSTMFLSKPHWVSIFVQADANVNEKDAYGHTALAAIFHYFYEFSQKPDEKPGFKHLSFLRELIINGSRLFIRDVEGHHIFSSLSEIQSKPNFQDPVILGKYITLKEMSAEIVEATYSKDFLRKTLPRDLGEYLW